MFQPKQNVYTGKNVRDYHVYKNGEVFDPAPSLKIRNHSPTGFAWGYWGSGPAQLSLAILLEEFNAEVAQRHYQTFKEKVVGNLPNKDGDEWTLTSDQVYAWMSHFLHGKVQHCKDEIEKYAQGSSEWRNVQHQWQDALREIAEVLGTRFTEVV